MIKKWSDYRGVDMTKTLSEWSFSRGGCFRWVAIWRGSVVFKKIYILNVAFYGK